MTRNSSRNPSNEEILFHGVFVSSNQRNAHQAVLRDNLQIAIEEFLFVRSEESLSELNHVEVRQSRLIEFPLLGQDSDSLVLRQRGRIHRVESHVSFSRESLGEFFDKLFGHGIAPKGGFQAEDLAPANSSDQWGLVGELERVVPVACRPLEKQQHSQCDWKKRSLLSFG